MWTEVQRRIDHAIHKLERKIMSTFKDLADVLAGIAADVTTVQAGANNAVTAINALKAQLSAAGTTLPADAQASLDAAVTQATAAKTALDGVASALSGATATATIAAGTPAAPTA